jgi:hypothetical protein
MAASSYMWILFGMALALINIGRAQKFNTVFLGLRTAF